MADGLGLRGLLGKQDRVDVGQHAAPGDGDAGQQLAELEVPGMILAFLLSVAALPSSSRTSAVR